MDPIKSGKPMAFKELRRLWESREVAGLFGTCWVCCTDEERKVLLVLNSRGTFGLRLIFFSSPGYFVSLSSQ